MPTASRSGALVPILYDLGGMMLTMTAEQPALKTEGDGRFHLDNVLPGERFRLSFIQNGKFLGGPKIADEKRRLKPGPGA